jgi:hypothetical protein
MREGERIGEGREEGTKQRRKEGNFTLIMNLSIHNPTRGICIQFTASTKK